MRFASNQANDIAGPLIDVLDEGNHNRDNATKGLYNVGQLSNSCLDTPNETLTSSKPRKKKLPYRGKFQLQYRNGRNNDNEAGYTKLDT